MTRAAPTLRRYQLAACEAIARAFASGKRAPLLVLPTGGGKTVIAAEFMRREESAGGRALFLAPRRELVHQASRSLEAIGLRHGVILAGDDRRDPYAAVQVGSIDTLLARLIRRRRLELLEPSLVIVDEAHLSITEVRQRLLNLWPGAKRLGLTATPTRKDGRALGILYDELIEPVTTADLTAQGFLVPARYFSLSEPDLARVRVVAGDFHAGELDRAVNRPQLVADIVQTWLARAAGRRTVVFATSIDHSAALAAAFLRAGVAAEHVDASTPQDVRDEVFKRFAKGTTQVLTNCFLASYGFDLPDLSCVVLARPTRSLMLYVQMLGRGLRIAPDKSDALVLDHAGNVHRHGFAADLRAWTLDGEYAIEEREQRAAKPSPEAVTRDCPECQAVFAGSRTCASCGYYFAPEGKMITTLQGDLVEVGAHLHREEQDELGFYLELCGFALERGFKPGWAAHQFREKFEHWPPHPWANLEPAMPSLETRRWVKSRFIAWRKAKESQGIRGVA